ncbi:hypothetical protein FOCC_FOCC015127 [Frankliniella occidentalis]|uniref:Outer mitochondrial transmembrane helix translocase n=1 Tax=Frankliniella occidentalis TaxID=133901 RepID=A0A6J1SWL8_FRAOC|nr:outer mitochondrial transmembrane helix translocase [Frankliniella occidentalis]KAE8739356.1 hypothetical protein FOCC_FOCC015127 [Frankliniella occidentalis]
MSDSFSRTEILAATVKLSVLAACTYVTLKFILGQLDPDSEAESAYKSAYKKAKAILNRLGLSNDKNLKSLSQHEMMIAKGLIDPQDITTTWDQIAGLDNVLQELRETVILPIQKKELFADSHLTRAPKGVLLFGPPGCGKTMIAKAIAREAGCNFINLDMSCVTDKWYGESQKLACAVFTLAVKLQPCIVFIDEIDSFLRNRSSFDHEATAMVKAQFMSLWDGLTTDPSCTVIVMGTTNRPQDLDRAILRRMPASFHIDMPNAVQRQQILETILKTEPVANDVNLRRLAEISDGFSGSDLRELCRSASVYRLKDFMNTNQKEKLNTSNESEDEFHDALRPITMEDLTTAYLKLRNSKDFCGADYSRQEASWSRV